MTSPTTVVIAPNTLLRPGDLLSLTFAGSEFNETMVQVIAAINEWTLVIERGMHMRPLSGAGWWAYRFVTWLGWSPLDVLCWLEECPGAFQDEFGEGWER